VRRKEREREEEEEEEGREGDEGEERVGGCMSVLLRLRARQRGMLGEAYIGWSR